MNWLPSFPFFRTTSYEKHSDQIHLDKSWKVLTASFPTFPLSGRCVWEAQRFSWLRPRLVPGVWRSALQTCRSSGTAPCLMDRILPVSCVCKKVVSPYPYILRKSMLSSVRNLNHINFHISDKHLNSKSELHMANNLCGVFQTHWNV